MRAEHLTALSDHKLLLELEALVAQDRTTTATLLLHIAEVDARRLYAPAGYSSMFIYCVEKLRFSEDAAYNRIYVARASRDFPALLDAIAEGRIHLSAARLLVPHLTTENVDELIAAASELFRKSDVEHMLARRSAPPAAPPTAAPTVHRSAQPVAPPAPMFAPEFDFPATLAAPLVEGELVPEQVEPAAPESIGSLLSNAALPSPIPVGQVPVSEPRFHLHVRLAPRTHAKLQYAQALLSHAVPSGDVEQILDRALDLLIARLERRKFGGSKERRSKAEGSAESVVSPTGAAAERSAHYIPAPARRAVWKRDGGRCTFVGASGQRCRARRFVEFDHIVLVAHGGSSTVENVRLRCRAHNQFEAERVLGRGFMRAKRALRRHATEPRVRHKSPESDDRRQEEKTPAP